MYLYFRRGRTERRADKDNLFITREQLSYDGVELFKKIPSLCVDCKSNDSYKMWIQEISGLTSFIVGSVEYVYWIKCANCNDVFEITEKNYLILKPLMILNYKFKAGKIDEDNYQVKNNKIMKKIAKKKKII